MEDEYQSVTIKFSDNDAGGLGLKMEFTPEIDDDTPNSVAVGVAMQVMEFVRDLASGEESID